MPKISLLCRILLAAGIGISLQSLALQVKPIQKNETVSAFVSKFNKTRIFVESDRITALRGTPGAYTTVNDDLNGQVFITPTTAFQKKPFSLFITTELGKTYGLTLIPHPSLSDSIELKPQTANKVEALHWETASSYENALVDLMRAMVGGLHPQGYEVTDMVHAKIHPFGTIATLQLQRVYQGAHFRGEIYQLKNSSHQVIHMTASEFYRPTTCALAMTRETIPVGGSILVYGVLRHE